MLLSHRAVLFFFLSKQSLTPFSVKHTCSTPQAADEETLNKPLPLLASSLYRREAEIRRWRDAGPSRSSLSSGPYPARWNRKVI